MLILLLMVGGCGVPSSASTPVVASRTVVDAEGTTVHVPETVTRLVTLSEPTLDGALALGVVPVGTVSGRGQNSVPNYLSDKAAGVAVLGTIAQPNYEAIGAVRPDLMLVDGTSINNNPPVIEALRRIAPVVVTGYAGGDWRLNFTHVADALNLADQGAEVMADYDAAVAGARGLLTGFSDSTFSIVRWQGGSASVILKELPPGQALSDLGLRRPSSQDSIGRGHSEPVSLENLDRLDADYLFFGTLGGSSVGNPGAGGAADLDGARSALADATAVPGLTDLTAYRVGHIILVDGSAWTSTGGPLLMRRLVDDVLHALR